MNEPVASEISLKIYEKDIDLPFLYEVVKAGEEGEDGTFMTLHEDGSIATISIYTQGLLFKEIFINDNSMSFFEFVPFNPPQDSEFFEAVPDADGNFYTQEEFNKLLPEEQEDVLYFQAYHTWVRNNIFFEIYAEFENAPLLCSFCHAYEEEENPVIVGPHNANICKACSDFVATQFIKPL